MEHACISSTQEVEAGGSEIRGYPGLYRKLKAHAQPPAYKTLSQIKWKGLKSVVKHFVEWNAELQKDPRAAGQRRGSRDIEEQFGISQWGHRNTIPLSQWSVLAQGKGMFEENNVLFLFSGTSEFLGFDYGFYCSSSLNAALTSAESILQPFSLTFSFLLEDVYLSVLYLTTTPSPSSPLPPHPTAWLSSKPF